MKSIKANHTVISNGKKIAAAMLLLVLSSSIFKTDVAFGKGVKSSSSIEKRANAKAESNDNTAIIRWNVAADGRYRFFIIERTKDKVHYEFVSMVKNTGSSASTISYSAVDHNPLAGTTYYRISATDLKEQPLRLFEVPFSRSVTQN